MKVTIQQAFKFVILYFTAQVSYITAPQTAITLFDNSSLCKYVTLLKIINNSNSMQLQFVSYNPIQYFVISSANIHQ